MLRYELEQRTADVEVLPGLRTRLLTYGGAFPGPTLVSRTGRPTQVTVRNGLTVPTVTHLHGGHTPAESDGYPTDLLLPPGVTAAPAMPGMAPDPAARVASGSRTHTYPMQQRAATLWYHDHAMAATAQNVWRGLFGLHLVHDDEEEALGLPSGDRDLPVVICDRSFAADGSLLYPPVTHDHGMAMVPAEFQDGVLGDVTLVNGVPWPVAEVPAVRHRLRLLNASNARAYRLALWPPPPGGGGLVQIGSDGGLLETPVAHDAVDLSPGERYDVVVDLGRYEPGTVVDLVNELEPGMRAVMRFRVGRRLPDDSRVPDRLSTVERLDPGARGRPAQASTSAPGASAARGPSTPASSTRLASTRRRRSARSRCGASPATSRTRSTSTSTRSRSCRAARRAGCRARTWGGRTPWRFGRRRPSRWRSGSPTTRAGTSSTATTSSTRTWR